MARPEIRPQSLGDVLADLFELYEKSLNGRANAWPSQVWLQIVDLGEPAIPYLIECLSERYYARDALEAIADELDPPDRVRDVGQDGQNRTKNQWQDWGIRHAYAYTTDPSFIQVIACRNNPNLD